MSDDDYWDNASEITVFDPSETGGVDLARAARRDRLNAEIEEHPLVKQAQDTLDVVEDRDATTGRELNRRTRKQRVAKKLRNGTLGEKTRLDDVA